MSSLNLSLRIGVADDEPVMRDYFQTVLPTLGHTVVSAAQNGRELVEQSLASLPDLIITDIKMPELDGIEAVVEISRQTSIPVILVSAYHERDLLQRAAQDHILAYLVKPIKRPDLEAAIAVAMQRFEQFRAMQKEAADLRRALADRKVIERAKGILMKRLDLDEEEAFRRLQYLASNKNRKLVEIAQLILTAEEVLQLPDQA